MYVYIIYIRVCVCAYIGPIPTPKPDNICVYVSFGQMCLDANLYGCL